MQDPTPEDRKEIDCAMRTVRDIDALTELEAFRGFLATFQGEADSMADQILHTDMPHEKRENLRQRYLGIREVLLAPELDRAAAMRILERHGYGTTENPESIRA
jgi:hypothetical protein